MAILAERSGVDLERLEGEFFGARAIVLSRAPTERKSLDKAPDPVACLAASLAAARLARAFCVAGFFGAFVMAREGLHKGKNMRLPHHQQGRGRYALAGAATSAAWNTHRWAGSRCSALHVLSVQVLDLL